MGRYPQTSEVLRSKLRKVGSCARRLANRRQWRRQGVLGPVTILSASEATRLAQDYRIQAAASGISATRNRHADLPALASLCTDPKVCHPLHDLLGDCLLLWRTNLFLGNPALPWHEDRHSRLFVDAAFSLSMILAIEDNPPDNFAVFLPGSHRLSVQEKECRFGIRAEPQAMGNIRYSGQVARKHHAPMHLKAGQAIVFHPGVLHASSGYLSGQFDASGARMSLTLRVTSPGAQLRDEAFPDERESADAVLRTIHRRAS